MKKVLLTLCALVAVSGADQLVKLNIDGMMCPACVKNVKGSLNEVNGVKEASVYLKEGRAEVKASDGTKPEAMCDAVKKAGYGCKVAK
ncbi:heavy-metal-associated domain-containing protein [Sulfuricurvum sp.]|uniref:heavy-metal-associated domain-containing protein n=1 Tax=Sulfuricurvum sp. TaxID=2025608 RepID=UPI0026276486|nr:heavy metal-associated domain-containing protein [Sulfuricurvum sp.]MDD2267818.1 heavy metal-associated domain-containing protein [Sulfuricurvum sp.]MDD2783508.1 heavy metal-associated domain-containing protein [Sulfuricurvum sp.]HZF70791.1 heavy metal-associated domain-containing protein [Sulfuricurvum sp.]